MPVNDKTYLELENEDYEKIIIMVLILVCPSIKMHNSKHF